MQHFLGGHECQFCDGSYEHFNQWYFEDPCLKKEHISENHTISVVSVEKFSKTIRIKEITMAKRK